MPPKLLQRSRLNSADIRPNSVDKTEVTKSTINFLCKLIEEKNSENNTEETEIFEDLDMEEETEKTEIILSRTELLILDYLQFKAARSIQRFVRGWLYRTKYQRKRKSAIIIQAQWRRFYGQRLYFRKLEETVQQRIEEHFYRSAQKIQALWRGWYSRRYIHDHTTLMHLQGTAGEDLLYCVAFKLHHLLRTHQIPGIYSLRNSTAFSKVEQLLATLSIKNFNENAREVRDHRENTIHYAKKKFQKSKYATEVPFTGPNINNMCMTKCMPLFTAKDADRKMARILQIYKDSSHETAKSKILKKKSKYLKYYHDKSTPTTFCDDVVRSIKKWNIIKDNKLEVENDVFEKPENVEKFLKEVESKLNFMQENCHCGQEYLSEIDKLKERNQNNNAVKLTTSLTSQAVVAGTMSSNEEVRYVANQRVFRNSVSTETILKNVYERTSATVDNIKNESLTYEGFIRNSIPARSTEIGKSITSNINKKSVTPLRSSSFKGILRNSIRTSSLKK